jgi:hypothetical protein
MSWGREIDVFSAGSIITELSASQPLFYVCEDAQERIAAMQHILGNFSQAHAQEIEDIRPGTFMPGDPPRVYEPRAHYPRQRQSIRIAMHRIQTSHKLLVRLF